jgi:pyruvate kinase
MSHEKADSAGEGARRAVIAKRALRRMLMLRRGALELEARHTNMLGATAPALRASARNLIHYLAVRSHDIRPLQADLARLGLSSLGRMEAHAMATLNLVIGLLGDIAGIHVVNEHLPETISVDQGNALLERHARATLGAASAGHSTRIMVTMPSAAAEAPGLIRDLLQRGMQIMRINCAHDGPLQWARMVRYLRQAERQLGRTCKVAFDLAGPKLRTGPIQTLPGVIKWRPQRDGYGRMVAPAVVHFSNASEAPPGNKQPIRVCGADLSAVRSGDMVHLVDARGRKRMLRVVEANAAICTCHADTTAYVASDTTIAFKRGKKFIVRTTVAPMPPMAQRIALRPGDQLLLRRGTTPGRPALVDRTGKVLAPAEISCELDSVFAVAKSGERIFFDDGRIEGRIRASHADFLTVDIVNASGKNANLGEGKGINLPDTDLRLPALTVLDRTHLDVVVRHADLVALSFLRRREDVEDLIGALQLRGAQHIAIVLKIETRPAFEHLPALLLAAMRHPAVAVMVARGDLGVEVGFERLSEVQEEILWLCEAAHLPVIWATQVLETLAKIGLSSRAEVTDAAAAGRAECVMLNKGPYILDALSFLASVLHRMQAHQTKKTSTFRRLRISRINTD